MLSPWERCHERDVGVCYYDDKLLYCCIPPNQRLPVHFAVFGSKCEHHFHRSVNDSNLAGFPFLFAKGSVTTNSCLPRTIRVPSESAGWIHHHNMCRYDCILHTSNGDWI